jgi:hypothetical protein
MKHNNRLLRNKDISILRCDRTGIENSGLPGRGEQGLTGLGILVMDLLGVKVLHGLSDMFHKGKLSVKKGGKQASHSFR